MENGSLVIKIINPERSKSQENQEENLLKFLAEHKWKEGYFCRKCGNENYCKGKKPYSRRCTRCKSEESATAHTIFHRCKIPLSEAFEIARMICCDPNVSTYELSRQVEKRQMTCWKFKTKILDCLKDPEKEKTLKELIKL